MKKIVVFMSLFVLFYTFCFSQTKELQFRLVLKEQESQITPFDKYIDKFGNEILVSKEILLSDKDIDKIGIAKGEFEEYLLIVEFTPIGKNKFYDVTGKYINRQLAQIIDDKVLADPYIREPIDTGWCAINVPSFSDAETLIKSIGFAPYLQYGIKNDDDAKNSYQFTKYAMEIGKQRIAEEIITQFVKYNPKSEFIQKLIGEYPSLEKTIPKEAISAIVK